MNADKVVDQALHILDQEGVMPTLRFLNRRGAHRFTAIYRFDGNILDNLYLVDKEDPGISQSLDIPVPDSYCVYVRETLSTFVTEDSRKDRRVEGHPKQDKIQAYLGVPLIDSDGLFGTLCHFDYEAVPFSAEEVNILVDLAPYILHVLRTDILLT